MDTPPSSPYFSCLFWRMTDKEYCIIKSGIMAVKNRHIDNALLTEPRACSNSTINKNELYPIPNTGSCEEYGHPLSTPPHVFKNW